jgi:hypothetical protein
LFLRLRSDNVLAWSHPEQSILAAVVGAYRLNRIQDATSVLIRVAKRLNIGIANRLTISIDDPSADRARRCHSDPDVGCVLLGGEGNRDAGTIWTALPVFGGYESITRCSDPVLACRKTSKSELSVAIHNDRLTRNR